MTAMCPAVENNPIHIESASRISELLSKLFMQLQLFGLFSAHFQTSLEEAVLDRLTIRPALLTTVATAIEGSATLALSLSAVPTISNRAQWSSPNKLGGYADRDLTVKLSEIIASYLGCWQNAVEHPDSASFRFIRLAFWYWREKGDVFAALELLADLYSAGFFLSQNHFGDAALTICDACTRDFDIATLAAQAFGSQEADRAVALAVDNLSERPHSSDKAQQLVDWWIERAIDQSERARAAPDPDDWVVQVAGLRITVQILHSLVERHRSYMAAAQRAIASQFEEVRADLGGAALVERLIAIEGRPLLFRVTGVEAVSIEYQRILGEGWLDKMLEDRLLVPNALCTNVVKAYSGTPNSRAREIEIPAEWRMVSESVAWPLCAAFGRDVDIECSQEFEGDRVVAACRKLGYEPESDGEGYTPNEFSSEAQAHARRELSVTQLATLLRDGSLFAEASANVVARLEEIATLYPWNHMIRRELGIRNDQSDNIEEGFRQMRAAVLLDPTDAMNWHSLSVVLRRLGEERDALLAAGISKVCEGRKHE
jgi:hypothetical protein